MTPEPPITISPILGTDFESYSEVSLKVVGTYRYCRHPSTQILCCSFGFTKDAVWVWRPGEPLPWQLIEYVRNGGILGAHNAAFERQMWNVQLVKYGAPPTPVNQWVCTAAQVAALAAPRRLDHAGEFFNLSQVKDTETGKILHKVCKPDRKGNKPILSVEDWDELIKYNKQDVVSELAIKDNLRPLQRSERLIWLMNEVINDRGIYVDIEFAKQARKLWETHSAQLNAKCQKLTGLNASQAEAIKDWIAKRGDPLNTLRKQAVADYLEDPTVDPDIREVLELRLEAGSAAVKKFAAFINCADSDSRVRGTQRYHAASTGRNGGMLIQPQNMKRPSLKVNQYEHAMELVRKQDLMAIKIFYGSVSDTLGSLCRATIQAAPGYKLIAGDFSQVEARNVAWFSGQHDLLAAFASGKDAYKFMASKVFGKPPESIDDDSHERFIGKQLVLGCFGAKTKVLTDSGWKPIVQVTTTDKLWDGVEWVNHLGVLYQGIKTVLKRHKVAATPDHLCLSPSGWQKWESVTTPQNIKRATGLVSLPSEVTGESKKQPAKARRSIPTGMRLSVNAVNRCYRAALTSTKAGQNVVCNAAQWQRNKRTTKNTFQHYPMKSTGKDCLTGYQQLSEDALTRETRPSKAMGEGALPFASSGLKTEQLSLVTSKQFRAGTTRPLKWTEKTTAKGTSPATSGLQPELRTQITGEPSQVYRVSYKQPMNGSKLLNVRMPVYDLLHAGPRNRFTILTDAGPLIVHNCGYQLGGDKFHRSLMEQFGVDVGRDNAVAYIKLYRANNQNIVNYWYSLQREVIDTVKSGRARTFGPLGLRTQGTDWLFITLPSGRDLAYYKPTISQDRYGDKLSFFGVDNKTKRGITEQTYGGKLLENICSGFCRDLMMTALLRLEMNGYPVVLTVHDEVICEVPESFGSAKEMEQIMTEVPPWAKGFPLASKCWAGKFYRK